MYLKFCKIVKFTTQLKLNYNKEIMRLEAYYMLRQADTKSLESLKN